MPVAFSEINGCLMCPLTRLDVCCHHPGELNEGVIADLAGIS